MFTVRAVKLSGLLADFEICELLQRPHHGRVIPALVAMRDAGIEQLLRGGSVGQRQAKLTRATGCGNSISSFNFPWVFALSRSSSPPFSLKPAR
jgi:hypothetical protein